MSGRWNRLFFLLLLVVGVGSIHAQRPLPALSQLAVEGQVVLFYPEGWNYTERDNGFSITGSTITITVEIVTDIPSDFDLLPDWMLENLELPANTQFQRKTYGGITGWLAQGTLPDNRYVAKAVLPEHQVVIQSDSSANTLRQDAPLITAIFDNVMILPATADSLRLPINWVFIQNPQGLFIAPDTISLEQQKRGEIPPLLGAVLSFENKSLDTLLSADPESEIRNFTVNGRPAVLQLRLNPTTQTPELLLMQEDETGLLVMTASTLNGNNLVRFLPHLQAIFASAAAN